MYEVNYAYIFSFYAISLLFTSTGNMNPNTYNFFFINNINFFSKRPKAGSMLNILKHAIMKGLNLRHKIDETQICEFDFLLLSLFYYLFILINILNVIWGSGCREDKGMSGHSCHARCTESRVRLVGWL